MNAGRAPLALLVAVLGGTPPLAARAADTDLLADPMRPAIAAPSAAAVESTAQAPSYALSAIKLDGPRSHAIVNGSVLHPGERLGAARVARIERRSVVLDTDRGPLTLRLNDLEIKRHADSRPVPR